MFVSSCFGESTGEMANIAILIKSAALPCIGAFMAARSIARFAAPPPTVLSGTRRAKEGLHDAAFGGFFAGARHVFGDTRIATKVAVYVMLCLCSGYADTTRQAKGRHAVY